MGWLSGKGPAGTEGERKSALRRDPPRLAADDQNDPAPAQAAPEEPATADAEGTSLQASSSSDGFAERIFGAVASQIPPEAVAEHSRGELVRGVKAIVADALEAEGYELDILEQRHLVSQIVNGLVSRASATSSTTSKGTNGNGKASTNGSGAAAATSAQNGNGQARSANGGVATNGPRGASVRERA